MLENTYKNYKIKNNMNECEKMEMFIEENMDIAMKYILWEQAFLVKENNIDLSDDDIQMLN
tara:strand:- start:1177 stop:1359 length:183 start_codon:yes stop_codon:yes gene_type:complete